MMSQAHFPYQCLECEQQPADVFSVFKEGDTADWLTAYVDEQAVHIHFGTATHKEAINVREAQFVHHFLMQLVTNHPAKNFFVFVDFTRSDDSEFVPSESMKLYRAILKHPQLRQGVIYGGTFAMHYLLKLLFTVSGNNVKIVSNRTEADEEYQRWLKKQTRS